VKKLIFRIGVVSLVLVGIIGMSVPVFAVTTADVTVTATPEYLAITNSEATWTIGTIAENTTVWWTHDGAASAEPYSDTEGKSIATNTGSVASDINAHTHHFPTAGAPVWTLAAAVGADTIVLGIAFATEANKAAWTKFANTTPIEIAHALAAAGHVHWAMYLDTGTFTDGALRTGTVTLTITKHT
jgi:hypothetical protein